MRSGSARRRTGEKRSPDESGFCFGMISGAESAFSVQRKFSARTAFQNFLQLSIFQRPPSGPVLRDLPDAAMRIAKAAGINSGNGRLTTDSSQALASLVLHRLVGVREGEGRAEGKQRKQKAGRSVSKSGNRPARCFALKQMDPLPPCRETEQKGKTKDGPQLRSAFFCELAPGIGPGTSTLPM